MGSFLAEDDPDSVADPTDLLVQKLGPQAASGEKSNKDGHESNHFRSENVHNEDHGVTEGQNAVYRHEDQIEKAGAAIRWREDFGGFVAKDAGEITYQ